MTTINALAKELKMQNHQLWVLVTKQGLGQKVGNLLVISDEEADKIRAMRKDRVTLAQLSAELGVSKQVLSKRVRRLGIKTKEKTRLYLTPEQAQMVREDVR